MTPNFRSVLVQPETSFRDTYRVMNDSTLMIALVVDRDNKLLGTVTDGDVRRGILKGLTLDSPIESVMNKQPITALHGTPASDLVAIMNLHRIAQIPLLNEAGIVMGLDVLAFLIKKPEKISNPAFILAGGFGRRLKPLTDNIPKPMLPIGGRPLLEILIERLASQGFQQCFVAVHYHEEIIRKSIGDGARLGIHVTYIQESEPMGTIGSLRLIADQIKEPIVVINGDLLTSANFQHLLKFHQMGGQNLTLALKKYSYQIPYGVVRLQGGAVVDIEEKPLQTNYVSAGMAVIDPSLLTLIPEKGSFDMPDLVRTALAHGRTVTGFPIHELWIDIGTPEDYQRAEHEHEPEPPTGETKG